MAYQGAEEEADYRIRGPMTFAPAPDNPHAPRLHALVPCAGSGTRAGRKGPKQYERLGERSLLAHTLAALGDVGRLQRRLVVVSPGDSEHMPHVAGSGAEIAHVGGATRAESVRNGLVHLLANGARADDWVLVHDAARCLVRAEWVDRLIDACLDDPVGGLLALPVADTLKAERGGRVEATIDRQAKWQAQTPQMFRIGALLDALDAASGAGTTVTDEAGAMEHLGHAPLLVHGALENIKITWPADFAFAERLLHTRG